MNALIKLLGQRRLLLASALLLAANGLIMWETMNRQEDPRLPDRWAMVVVPFPGADAETVERLVLERVEDALADISEIHKVEGLSRAGVAIVNLVVRGDISDTDPVWDKVRRKLRTTELPPEAGPPRVNADLTDQESIVLAVEGAVDPLVLAEAAKQLEDALEAVPLVARTVRTGDPGAQITVAIDDAVSRRLGLNAALLAGQLRARNVTLPGGSVLVAGRNVILRPETELRSVEALRRTPIMLPSGAAVALGEVATVRLQPREPVQERARVDGAMAVVVGVVPRRGVDVVRFGAAVRAKIAALAPTLAPLKVREVAFQPDRVASRLSDLGQSLLLGILIVSGVLIATMGLRMGLVVASVVPLVAFSSLGIYGLAGGILHQISISALVIALGLLVDNAIVVSESVQANLDAGLSGVEAAMRAVRELALPLGAATGTTLAAFVPMLLSTGPTGDFTRALPIVIMLTLTVSYGFAVLVTPVLSAIFLRPSSKVQARHSTERSWAGRLGAFAVRRRRWVLLSVAGEVPFQFFPTSDRNQMVVDLRLPEGTHLDTTDAATRTVEALLRDDAAVTGVSAFVGRSVPHFYYNLPRMPQSPHLAQLVVRTANKADLGPVARRLSANVAQALPEVDLVPRRLEQGPPVKAPIEIRLLGDDLQTLHAAAGQVMTALRTVPGARDVRHDQGVGVPVLRFEIDDAAAGRQGLARVDVARALLGRTLGLPAGTYRPGDEPRPVVVRAVEGDRFPAEALSGVDVGPPGTHAVPLGQVAQAQVEWRPATIRHRNRARVVTVTALLTEGTSYSEVQRPLQLRLDALQLPPSITVQLGGASEGAGEAN